MTLPSMEAQAMTHLQVSVTKCAGAICVLTLLSLANATQSDAMSPGSPMRSGTRYEQFGDGAGHDYLVGIESQMRRRDGSALTTATVIYGNKQTISITGAYYCAAKSIAPAQPDGTISERRVPVRTGTPEYAMMQGACTAAKRMGF
jgi:hypothetical protein